MLPFILVASEININMQDVQGFDNDVKYIDRVVSGNNQSSTVVPTIPLGG